MFTACISNIVLWFVLHVSGQYWSFVFTSIKVATSFPFQKPNDEVSTLPLGYKPYKSAKRWLKSQNAIFEMWTSIETKSATKYFYLYRMIPTEKSAACVAHVQNGGCNCVIPYRWTILVLLLRCGGNRRTSSTEVHREPYQNTLLHLSWLLYVTP